MDLDDDGALLRKFAVEGDEGAFRALVGRHLALVQGIATRQLGGDGALAEDVAQRVFALLAARAGRMSGHPSVAGWLFTTTRKTAANARRANLRRLRRETEGATMQTDETRAETAALWQEVRPLLDEGLARLGEGEREALLWRIVEGAGYAEIAARLGLKESAARMRVDRALEKLRGWLARRGVTSTAAALGAAVGAHAAPAVTAAAVAKVATSALAVAAAAGGVTTTFVAAVDFMSKAKVLGTVAAVAVGLTVYEAREVRRQARETQAWQQRALTAEQQVAGQREELAEALRRAQAADDDNARLVAGIAQAGPRLAARSTANEGGSAKVSRAEATQRLERAKTLRKEGKYREALAEFLWCFDAMRGFSFFGQHTITIPEELAKLVADYPAAREVIRAKQDEARRRAMADEQDNDAMFDFAGLTKALGEPSAIVDAMNQFQKGDPRRDALFTNGGYDALLAARSYGAVVAERPYEKMAGNLEFQLTIPGMMGSDDAQRTKIKQSAIDYAARDFEVLVGAGSEAQAQALAAKILAADSSAEVRAKLAEHAARAGRSDWKLP